MLDGVWIKPRPRTRAHVPLPGGPFRGDMTANESSVAPGETVRLTLTAENLRTRPAEDVELCGAVPTGFSHRQCPRCPASRRRSMLGDHASRPDERGRLPVASPREQSSRRSRARRPSSEVRSRIQTRSSRRGQPARLRRARPGQRPSEPAAGHRLTLSRLATAVCSTLALFAIVLATAAPRPRPPRARSAHRPRAARGQRDSSPRRAWPPLPAGHGS